MEKTADILELRCFEINFLKNFRTELFACKDPLKIESRLRLFLEFYNPVDCKQSYSQCYWRARPCNDRNGFRNLSQLLSPPSHETKNGRMNEEGRPVLYASDTLDTALSEMGASENKYFHVIALAEMAVPRYFKIGAVLDASRCRPTNNEDNLDDVRAIIDRLSLSDKESFVAMDALAAEIFLDRKAKSNNYVYSRIFQRLLRENLPDVDAIAYPSVAAQGTNIAIPPSKSSRFLTPEFSSVIRIDRKKSDGIYEFRIQSIYKEWDDSGNFRSGK